MPSRVHASPTQEALSRKVLEALDGASIADANRALLIAEGVLAAKRAEVYDAVVKPAQEKGRQAVAAAVFSASEQVDVPDVFRDNASLMAEAGPGA